MTAVVLAFGLATGTADNPANRPNVLFLLTDDQRPDAIAALGNPIIKTPSLDKLVRQGTSFSRAICAYPICTPSRAEILTGCSAFTNGVMDFGRKIDPSLATWAATMKNAGYHTWYVGKWHNNGRPQTHGFEETRGLFAGGGGKWAVDRVDYRGTKVTGYRGWIFQDDEGNKFPDRGVGLTPTISADFADAAISLIMRKSDKPFFLQVNFTAPHDPLLIPPGYEKTYSAEEIPLPANFRSEHPFDHGNFQGRDEKLLPWPRTPVVVRRDIAAYYAVIDHLDKQIGRILAALDDSGKSRNTIVIFSSDHGLAVGSHGLRGKQNMYEHTINVPLIVKGPGIPAGNRSNAQVYLRDLFPTACELCGIPVPKSVEGVGLKDVLTGMRDRVRDYVVGYFRESQRMIRGDRYKLIVYPEANRVQLFDLRSDPFEVKNLADDPSLQAVRTEYEQRLQRWLKEKQRTE